MKNINQRIKIYLAENGVTQYSLSKKLGISPSSLHTQLNGSHMDVHRYVEICELLDVPCDYFLNDEYWEDYRL